MAQNEFSVLSVAPAQFKGNDGQVRTLFKVYMADDTGAVGCVYSPHKYVSGDVVQLQIYVKNDGKFAVRIVY